MKKLIVLISVISFLCLHAVSWAGGTSSDNFKYYMHKVFDSYSHARISYTLNKHEITDVYLRQMKEFIAQAQKDIPEHDKQGAFIDKVLFMGRVAKLQTTVSDLRGAVKYRAPLLTELFARDIFDVCVACHREMKFDHLFSLPQHMTLFGEYMHKVSEHIDLARMQENKEHGSEMVGEQLRLINYYLDLLKTVLPEEGPSGVILDKASFNQRIQTVQEAIGKHETKEKKIDLADVRKSISGLCVACHEPEKL